ncbi:hypothetical protein GCM10011363_29940 [Marivita lacus]|uniref:Periplasmic copper-binding protein NosD beta helix domain-containing protein n=1 Tax=Marivita lacus TaxID=1323742 RepID=A0ABQ1KW62_9RHOB|nr:right-handed parallel beta-helix repeat-containing protein [Marivita lacus]GGC11284.1 hypothetical protein GCM10011363_29940 [Marivita lacus]
MDKSIPILSLSILTLLPIGAGAQQFDYLAHQRMENAVARLSDPQTADDLAVDADAIMATLGLAWSAAIPADSPDRSFEPEAGAVIELVDIRLLLTQIAIQAGARDHHALLRAQGERERNVILLRGGAVALPELFRLSRDTPAQDFVIETPEGIRLTRPLAIWSDAGLSLDAKDHLVLDQASGSFVANLGRLDVQGGTISGNTGENIGEPGFRPFVLTAGRGGFTAKKARFRHLGFGKSPVFGGITVVNNGLVVPEVSSIIADSSVDDVATLALIGTTDAAVFGNRISNSTAAAILISNAQGSFVSDNHLIALTGPQAIRITAGSSDVRVRSNLLSGASRMGILVDPDSYDVTISGNLVTGSEFTGVSVDGARCILLTDNLVAGNSGAGISLKASDEIIAANNAILFNHGSGVLVRDQVTNALVQLSGNVLMANRDGLRGATPGNVLLQGNDLERQMPRVFAGDLAALNVNWLRNRRHATPVSVQSPTRAGCAPQGNG